MFKDEIAGVGKDCMTLLRKIACKRFEDRSMNKLTGKGCFTCEEKVVSAYSRFNCGFSRV